MVVVEAALIFEGQVSEAPNGDVDEWVWRIEGILIHPVTPLMLRRYESLAR